MPSARAGAAAQRSPQAVSGKTAIPIAALEEELNDICADLQEGGSWSRHRARFRELNRLLASHSETQE